MKLAHALFIVALLATASNATSSFDGSRYLWYTKPTTEWEQGALPIGNGRLGGTVWGGANETLTINEDTIWSGPIQDRTPPNALATLPVARKLFLSGKITEGGQLVLREMTPAEKSERQFGYFGNLDLDFGHSGNLENYVRWLDTKQGNSGSSYAFDGVNFTREFVASYPAGVLAARFTSSEEGALNLKANFSRLANILVNVASTAGGVNSVTLMSSSGQPLDENPILFTGQARFVAPGGMQSL
ncbi:hypothetical protein Brms1b_010433 [Colletotrichum noveboracense]|nr:hypothetical protein CBS470a_009373 [Colletotrichum nupharicola]KAJ0306469.1 hypothetical protein Brms1b_010433 [Colletotrichum noveboracense]